MSGGGTGRGPVAEMSVRLDAQLIIPEGADGLWVELGWRRSDPFAVGVFFEAAQVLWLIGRELLAEGLIRPAGIGDVQVRPDETGRGLLVELWAERRALVRFDAVEVGDFVAALDRAASLEDASGIELARLETDLPAPLSGGV